MPSSRPRTVPTDPTDIGPEHVALMNAELDGVEPHEIVKYACTVFGRTLTMACSFQDNVMLDIASKVAPDVRVFTIDTGFLFHETEETIRRAREHYPWMRIDVFSPRLDIGTQSDRHGRALYRRDHDSCCAIRKLEPMQRALDGHSAWMTGIRRDQSASRATVKPVAWDHKWDMVKFAPMWSWTRDDIRVYADVHDVPYNRLIDRGYPSIGCAPCTGISDEGDARSGRWAGSDKTECGLHDHQSETGSKVSERWGSER